MTSLIGNPSSTTRPLRLLMKVALIFCPVRLCLFDKKKWSGMCVSAYHNDNCFGLAMGDAVVHGKKKWDWMKPTATTTKMNAFRIKKLKEVIEEEKQIEMWKVKNKYWYPCWYILRHTSHLLQTELYYECVIQIWLPYAAKYCFLILVMSDIHRLV